MCVLRWLIMDMVKTNSANPPGRNTNQPKHFVYSARADYAVISPGGLLHDLPAMITIPPEHNKY